MSIHSTGFGDHESSRSSPLARTRGSSAIPIKYARVRDWLVISGMGRTSTYEALAAGWLPSVKLNGVRLIDVEAGLAYLANLPPAPLTTGLRKRRVAGA
jgi:hypothetical protein